MYSTNPSELLTLRYLTVAPESATRVEAASAATLPAPEVQEGDGEETGGPKVLSKKEKEKLKKEREKVSVDSNLSSAFTLLLLLF